ncbi:MAG: molybdopterin molybdotransferase MoeA, partial [Mycobacteriaceae bacterium]
GNDLKFGQIYESNGIMLATAVHEAGAIARHIKFTPDDVDQFLSTLAEHSTDTDTDLIITSGGVSAGAYEVVKDSLSGTGVNFTKVAMQPGMPQGAGVYAGVPIVTLPGNPVSAQVSFEVFVRPALRSAMGFNKPQRQQLTATLGESITSPSGKRQYRRGVLDTQTRIVHTIGPPASHFLRWMASANCLLEIEEKITHLDQGSSITVWDLQS